MSTSWAAGSRALAAASLAATLAAPLAAVQGEPVVESLAAPVAPGSVSPHLAVEGDRLLLTWIEPAPGGGHRLRFALRGATGWSRPTTIAAGRDLLANWADTPGVVAAGDGSLVAWWLVRARADAHAYDAELARSTDGGASFAPLGRLNDDGVAAEHGFVSGLAEGSGARLFYLDGRATPTGGATQLRSVLVEAGRVGASRAIDDAVCDCCPTAAVRLATGDALVAYRDREPGEIRDVRLLRLPVLGEPTSIVAGGERWQMPGCPVNGPALAAAGADLATAWFSAAGDRPRLAVAVSRDGGRTLSTPVELDAAAPLGRAAAAALGDGFAVAWLARSASAAELRLARVDRAGRPAGALTLARLPAGRATGVPRLVRWGERLILAWTAPEPAPGGIEVVALPLAALPTR